MALFFMSGESVTNRDDVSRPGLARPLVRIYLSASRRVWDTLPAAVRRARPGRACGRHLHRLACRYTEWKQNHSTWFLRNRPELQLMCRLLERNAAGSRLDLCVLGCSKGAEVYSMLWAIRSAHPQLSVRTTAIDISSQIVEFASQGVYSRARPAIQQPRDPSTDAERLAWNTYRDQGPDEDVSIFDRMTEQEIEAMFVADGAQLRVRAALKDGISWRTGDASDANLARALPPQDIVVANRFLCHMPPEAAEACLRNLSRLVRPGGFLFVSGVDLDVRTRVAKDLAWKPIVDLIREVHEGDPSLTAAWPFAWYGLEPFCDDEPDWNIRYAAVFQVSEAR